MTEHTNPVREARAAIRGAGRPLTAREAVLITAYAHAATVPGRNRGPLHPATTDRRELIYDVVTDLRDAVVDATITGQPGPAIRAIRRLLEAVGIDVGDPEWTPTANLPAPRPPDAREAAAGTAS